MNFREFLPFWIFKLGIWRKDKMRFAASMIREFSPAVIWTSREQFIIFQATLMRTGLAAR